MREHDILVFPSLFEGFGMVILEAMSQGMVVLATEHTAAPDIISNGVDGYIIPLRSSTSIAETILKLHDDRDLLASVAAAAQMKAETFTWLQYEQEVVRAVTSVSPLHQ
jgi:glycosyltransferase involved in cell wall biosynthesis